MNAKQTAELWGVNVNTVYTYCRKGYVEGAYKKGRQWVIPDGYKQPFISRKKIFKSIEEEIYYVLSAYESGKYIDLRLIAMSEEKFYRYSEMLLKSNYLTKNNGVYEITVEGILLYKEFKNGNKKGIKDIINMLKTVVETVSVVAPLIQILYN